MGAVSALERLFITVTSRARLALTYQDYDAPLNQVPAWAKIVSLTLVWVGLLSTSLPYSFPTLALVGAMALLSPRSLAASALGLALIPASFIGVAALVLSPHPPLTAEWALRAATLASRTLGLSLASLLTFATTSPLELAGLFSRRPQAHDFIIVVYRSLPLTVGDMVESLVAQSSLGKPLHHTLVPSTLMALRRAEGLSLSLYTRGYTLGPRTRIPVEKRVGPAVLLLSLTLASLAVTLVWKAL